ncbi:MAG: DUF2459 domain-containing protein [Ignavibacteria bacterium]|nr:DUF2459 domain-containing protein [Ignavibacteria bacterium]
MKKIISVIYIIIVNGFLFCQPQPSDSISIYLVKESWHTGIMIPVNEYTITKLPVAKYFKEFLFIDIGWGDADFYQTPGSDIFLAAKAILIPTPTVIRVDGYKFPIEKVIEWRDFAIELSLKNEEFIKLATYINESFIYNDRGEHIISKSEEGKPIIFFKSKYFYYFLRTCNTWAAEVIQSSGKDIDTFGLVTAGQLYSKVVKYGKVLKKFD